MPANDQNKSSLNVIKLYGSNQRLRTRRKTFIRWERTLIPEYHMSAPKHQPDQLFYSGPGLKTRLQTRYS